MAHYEYSNGLCVVNMVAFRLLDSLISLMKQNAGAFNINGNNKSQYTIYDCFNFIQLELKFCRLCDTTNFLCAIFPQKYYKIIMCLRIISTNGPLPIDSIPIHSRIGVLGSADANENDRHKNRCLMNIPDAVNCRNTSQSQQLQNTNSRCEASTTQNRIPQLLGKQLN